MKIRCFWSFLFLAGCLQQSFQWCHEGHLWNEPNSQSVNIGESVSFLCEGHGSHLYWFIDGINTVNMSSQEISDRGMSSIGFYNHFPPYSGYCDWQHSYLTMTGNCLNNNTEIYCVILGIYSPSNGGGNRTSSIASLVVKGDPTVISQFTVVQASAHSLLMYWELESVSNENYTQTLTVEEGNTTVYSMELDKLDQHHLYKSGKAFDPCIQYNITLTIETINITCRDSWTITKYLTGEPLKPENVSASEKVWKHKYLIKFQLNSPLCQGSLPFTIKSVLLNDNNGDLISSDVIPWNNVTTLSDKLYQIELNSISLKDNAYYYLLIVSQSEYGQAISDPIAISTFDVIDAQYSFINDTAEFCVTCIFANESQAIGCVAVLFTTTNIYSMKITKDTSSNTGSDCVTVEVGDSGLYSISVYDWEGNEDDIVRNEPAVKAIMYLVNEAVTESRSQSHSSSIIQASHTSNMMNITAEWYSSSIIQTSSMAHMTNTTVEHLFSHVYETIVSDPESQQHVNGDTVGVVFGTLFGVSLMLVLMMLIALGVLVKIGRKKSSNAETSSSSNNRSNDDTPMQRNSAYELVKVQQRQRQVECNSSSHISVKQGGHGHTTHVYETVIPDPVNYGSYQIAPAPTKPIYANVCDTQLEL